MFSFLSKDIVIHTISSILGTRNLLHFNAKGIEIIFVIVYSTVFLFSFFFSKARMPMYDLTDGFISTACF